MARKPLPKFARDQHTGSLKEFTHGGPNDFALVSDADEPPCFRVLVADDNEADRLLTIWMLGLAWPAERDMLVECAADGAEALEKIQRNHYALVVLDWNLPNPDGADVLQAIRGNGLRVPVVVVSEKRREALAAELEFFSAAFVNKDELDTHNFSNAIAASLHLQSGQSPGAH